MRIFSWVTKDTNITDSIAVAVLETAWIDLIDYRTFPPRTFCGCHSCSHSFKRIWKYERSQN